MRNREFLAGSNSSEVPPISETGRLFLRNLPYQATEADLTALFEEYGELSEVHLVVDRWAISLPRIQKIYILLFKGLLQYLKVMHYVVRGQGIFGRPSGCELPHVVS